METAACKGEDRVRTTATSGNAIKCLLAVPVEVKPEHTSISWPGGRGLAGPEPHGGGCCSEGRPCPPGVEDVPVEKHLGFKKSRTKSSVQ